MQGIRLMRLADRWLIVHRGAVSRHAICEASAMMPMARSLSISLRRPHGTPSLSYGAASRQRHSAQRSLMTSMFPPKLILRRTRSAYAWKSHRSYEVKASSWEACDDIMRRRDMDNMLCMTFLPPQVQQAW
jgi:hypothetical protein